LNTIETKRLFLVPLNGSRLEEFIALTADPDVMRFWGPGGPFSRDAAERNFAASLARLESDGFGRRWLVSKDCGVGLGFTELKYFGESCADVSPAEIGWMLKRSAWGQGYATEAGAAILDEAFVSLELESVVAVHHPGNPASARIMEKLQMEFERDVVSTTGWPYIGSTARRGSAGPLSSEPHHSTSLIPAGSSDTLGGRARTYAHAR
jgi:RimJ/RimL family protein N-acetyltransferase